MRPDEIVNGRPTRNLKTGRFLKGHIPHSAGKTWDDWLSKEKQRKCLDAGRKNLRPNPNVRGWNRRAVVAVEDSGKYRYCESAEKAAEILGLDARNIRACCKGKRVHCGKWRWFYFDSNEWVRFVKERQNDNLR